MSFLEHLPFILWWLFIMALTALGLFLIGTALIGLIIEREDAQE